MPKKKVCDSKSLTSTRVGRGDRAKRRPARVRNTTGSHPRTARGSVSARKQPRQRRSLQMVEAILEAAAELFAAEGYARATTNKIAARAGVSVGSLYQYFPNKDSLLAALFERHHADVHRVVSAALLQLADPAVPLDAGLRRLLTDLVGLHHDNPALTKALSTAVIRESSAADDVHKHEDDHIQPVLALLAARPDVRTGDYGSMALVMGQATAHLTRWLVHDAPPGTDEAVLLEEVVQLLVRYLHRSAA